MSRPQILADVQDRSIRLGDIDVSQLLAKPKLNRAWAEFTSVLEDNGGYIENPYNTTVTVYINRTTKQLKEQLDNEQRLWDHNRENYIKAQEDRFSIHGYMYSGLNAWARDEGLDELERPTEEEYEADKAAKKAALDLELAEAQAAEVSA